MPLKHLLKSLNSKHPWLSGTARDLAGILAAVAAVALVLYVYSGVWPPMVSVISESMDPNMQKGDIVLIQGLNRCGITTLDGSASTGYRSFNDPGDVIVYYPGGDRSKTPIIHRAIRWVNESEPMWPGGPCAPYPGYVTRGDNNGGIYDQDYRFDISPMQPVKKEWISGISKIRIPYLGYLRPAI